MVVSDYQKKFKVGLQIYIKKRKKYNWRPCTTAILFPIKMAKNSLIDKVQALMGSYLFIIFK